LELWKTFHCHHFEIYKIKFSSLTLFHFNRHKSKLFSSFLKNTHNNLHVRCCFAKYSSETKKTFGISSMFWLFSPSRPIFTCYLTVYVDCIWVKNSHSSHVVFSFIKCACVGENIPVMLTVGAPYSSNLTFQSWKLMLIHWSTVRFIHNMTHIYGSKTTFQAWKKKKKNQAHVHGRKSFTAGKSRIFCIFLFIDSEHVQWNIPLHAF